MGNRSIVFSSLPFSSILRVVALSFLFFTSAGHTWAKNWRVPDHVYHPVPKKADDFITGNTCAIRRNGWVTECLYPHEDRQVNFKTAFLEFNGSGNEAEPNQLKAITGYIDKRNQRGRKLLVVTYVHGWHHNAKSNWQDEDGNVLVFRDLLARYANELRSQGNLDTEVLGIYVGWPGEIISTPLVNELTVVNRAAVADAIGQGFGLRADLHTVALHVLGGFPQNRLVVMGHSFGGRIVSEALLPELEGSEHQEPNPQPLGPGSLVLTINPAIGADRFDKIFSPNHMLASTSQLPTWLNITSKDDWATKDLYPWAMRVRNPLGSAAFRHTIGHYEPYETHRLRIMLCGDADCAWDTSATPPDSSPSMWSTSSFHFGDYQYGPDTYCTLMTEYVLSNEARSALERSPHCQTLVKKVTGDLDQSGDTPPFHAIPLGGHFWNIETDRDVIDDAQHSFLQASTHNGYVQTNLVKAVVQLIYDPAWPGSPTS